MPGYYRLTQLTCSLYVCIKISMAFILVIFMVSEVERPVFCKQRAQCSILIVFSRALGFIFVCLAAAVVLLLEDARADISC